MKNMKRLLAMLLIAVVVCAIPTAFADEAIKPVKIAMMMWDNGPQQNATMNYCKALEEGIDGLSFVFGQLDSSNADANVAACQAMIAQGCNGIILYNQTGGLDTIVEMANEAGVYVGCYLTDPDDSLKALINDNPAYVGSAMDGPTDTASIGRYAAQIAIENGYRHIGSVSFPLDIMAPMKVMVDAFYAAIDEHNATVADDEKIEIYPNEEVWFTQVDASYFANYPEMDAVFGSGGGVLSVYPTIVQAKLTDKVKLISTGMLYDDDTIAAIENGNIVLASTSSIEQLIYPVALIFNAVQGQKYPDQPETPETRGCGIIYFRNADDIKTVKEHSYLYAENYQEYDRLMLTPENAKQFLLAYNADATYASLVELLDSLNVDTLKTME